MGHSDRIRHICLSLDEELLASSGFDGKIILWNVSSGEQIRIIEGHNDHRISSVTFSFDSKTIVSSAYDLLIKIWSIDDGECLQTLVGHNDWVKVVSFVRIIKL
jgi:WD40 repeat protein